MGNNKSSTSYQMPPKLKSKVLHLFSLIDKDGSKSIDREETLKFWGNNFAVLNAQELFKSVDKDNSGTIEISEWLEFWYNVYKSGNKEEDLIAEVKFLLRLIAL